MIDKGKASDPTSLAEVVNEIGGYRMQSTRTTDPIQLVCMVNQIDGYRLRSTPTTDPIRLARMVNQIGGYKLRPSLQSPSPPGRAGRAGWGRH